jgi:type II restriction/modification system DNA methylase subunit YeeA
MALNIEDLERIPILYNDYQQSIISNTIVCIDICKKDWDSYETSYEFKTSPILVGQAHDNTIKISYSNLRQEWLDVTAEMQHLENENNRVFIDAYGLQNELTPNVPLKEITLTCNPYYRYGDDKTPEQLEGLLLQDTMKEFISYSVGCMFGRYSLDKPGLVLANQGGTLEDYLKQVPQPTFMPDGDNVIPLMEVDWFPDDLVERFKRFLKTTFGEENFEENLRFIEEALGYKTNGKGKPQPIRDYFLNTFYTDHLKTYKKRPIYWMFSSPKGTFNALIYMHRYRPDTVSIILNDYLRVFRTKLEAYLDNKTHESISPTATAGQKTAALREIEKLKKQIAEIDEYERDILYPLAGEKIEIDLDDGVKKNYPRFGKALRTIPGLDKGEE